MATKKWQVIEGVVAAIERSLATVPGTRVVPNAMVPRRGEKNRRQVDVLVEIPSGPRTLRIAVEVRDKRNKLDVTQIEQLAAKLASLEVDRGCIVSSFGVTNQARSDAMRYGVELHTLSEVDAPDWWLPSAMTLERREVHLLRWQLNYPSDEVAKMQRVLSGRDVHDLNLIAPPAPPRPLGEFVAEQGIVASNQREFQDEEVFGVTIDLTPLTGAHLAYSGGTALIPSTITAEYQMHHRVELVPLTAFELDPTINAFSGVSAFDGKQFTIVAHAQLDGTRTLAVSIADSKPKRTKIAKDD